jgi:hypothetical protein
MKKLTDLLASAAVVAAIFLGSNAKAQTIVPNKWRFGVGVEGGLVTGDAHNYSNVELGGTARLQYGFSNNVALTGVININHWVWCRLKQVLNTLCHPIFI